MVKKSCVTFLLCDLGWYVHKPDVQNEWDDNTHKYCVKHLIDGFVNLNVAVGIPRPVVTEPVASPAKYGCLRPWKKRATGSEGITTSAPESSRVWDYLCLRSSLIIHENKI